MNNMHINMDSFGSDCPANWQEIANYLNECIDAIIDSYGDDAEYSPDCRDEIANLWERYCNGELKDAPVASEYDIHGERM